jgi:hypothetical protein
MPEAVPFPRHYRPDAKKGVAEVLSTDIGAQGSARSSGERRPKAEPRLLPGVANNSPWVRRARNLIREHTNDLGGPDAISGAEHSLIRRAAVLTVELEALEYKFANSEHDIVPSDFDLYIRGSGGLRRLLEAIGIRRRPRDLNLIDPLQYAAQRAQSAPQIDGASS